MCLLFTAFPPYFNFFNKISIFSVPVLIQYHHASIRIKIFATFNSEKFESDFLISVYDCNNDIAPFSYYEPYSG